MHGQGTPAALAARGLAARWKIGRDRYPLRLKGKPVATKEAGFQAVLPVTLEAGSEERWGNLA